MPSTLTTINNYAFAYCSSLGEFYIPRSVATIGSCAFNYTGRLVFLIEASVDQPGWQQSTSQDYPWYGNSSSSKTFIYNYVSRGVISDFKYVKTNNGVVDTIYIIGLADGSTNPNLVVPDEIEGITNIKIASYAFDGNTLIETIDLGHSVTAINTCAFRGYSSATSSLVSVIIPSSCETIGSNAFQYCNSGCVIHCEAESQPSGWNSSWNSSSATVDWGYTR